MLMVIPEAVVGMWFIRMPESPKFYIAKGDPKRALLILKTMYSINTGEHPDTFPVEYLTGMENGKDSDPGVPAKKSGQILLSTLKHSRLLFKSPLIVLTALTCVIMFANMFG